MLRITNISNHSIDLMKDSGYDRLFVGEFREIEELTEQMKNLIDPYKQMLLLEVYDSE